MSNTSKDPLKKYLGISLNPLVKIDNIVDQPQKLYFAKINFYYLLLLFLLGYLIMYLHM